jgi:unsaturated rhamnogalacturonyl hydrolase
VDSVVDEYGNIRQFNAGWLDDLQPGILLFPLYQKTGDRRYKDALDTVAWFIERFPRNAEGGFWHKSDLRNQMWLDGLYMGGPFAAQYAAEFDRPQLFDLDVLQAELMERNTRDNKTGLWYHACDCDRRQPWADPVTGCSPEFWGRSMGWVPVALLNELDFFPNRSPGRKALRRIAHDLLTALLPYQDESTGLWYQVVNRKGEAGNWLETSCTCLYAAALCKAVATSVMDESCLGAARKAALGIFERLEFGAGGLLLNNICVGTGVGDYAFYCARPRSVNDLHGMGAFLILCAEAERVL